MGEMSVFYSVLVYLCTFIITIHNVEKVSVQDMHRSSCKLWVLLAALPFILVYGLRFEVGVDYKTYLDFYNYTKSTGKLKLVSYLEPGYVALNYLAVLVFREGYGIFLIVGILLILLLYRLIEQYRNDISVSLMLYSFFMVYFGVSCNVVRQMIAVMICANSYHCILNRKPGKFIFGVLVAALFHKSALFCILLYFLSYIRSSIGVFSFKISCCSMGLFCILFQNKMLSFMKYIKWYSGHFSGQNSGNGISGLAFLLYVVPTLILIGLTQNSLINKKRNYQFMVLLMWLQIPLQCCGVFNPVIERMSLYCSIAQIILVPAIVKSIKDSLNRQIWEFVFKIWYLIYFVVMDIYLAGNAINSYQIWNFQG